MTSEKWLLIDGKVHKLVDTFGTEKEANIFALVLQENCHASVHQLDLGQAYYVHMVLFRNETKLLPRKAFWLISSIC